MKVLSVIVPVYNTEVYLPRCLDSLLYDKRVASLLEIILVNDGGKDGSINVMRNYRNIYPDIIKIIDKGNGGHGSTINAGMKIAGGKYVRILDSDDWVNIDYFGEYVKRLRSEVADIVFTGYTQDILYSSSEVGSEFFNEDDARVTPLAEIFKHTRKKDFSIKFDMHAITVSLDVLKKTWQDLDEKTFYVDQEFIALVALACESYVQYGMDIYRYFIGRPDQSVGSGFFRHRDNHEKVLRWLLKKASDEHEGFRQKMLDRQVRSMITTHYNIYLSELRLSASEKKELLRFDAFIRSVDGGKYGGERAGRNLHLRLVFFWVKRCTAARLVVKVIKAALRRGVQRRVMQ